jgi:Ring finger domain
MVVLPVVESGQQHRPRAFVAVDEEKDEVAANVAVQSKQDSAPFFQPVEAPRDNHDTATDDSNQAVPPPPTTTTINTPTTAEEEAAQQQQQQQQQQQERQRREEEELEQSIELARMLMAEEAMASYQQSFQQLLRDSADQLSPEDYNALQAAMMEDERDEAAEFLNQQQHQQNQHRQHGEDDDHEDEQEEEGEGGHDDEEDDDEEQHLSYETLLQLGERIGDVKAERWAMEAHVHIDRLPIETFQNANNNNNNNNNNTDPQNQYADDSEQKCLVCQCEYEDKDTLRRLVMCGHCFHADCVDQWLARTDLCPYCRTSIIIAPATSSCTIINNTAATTETNNID